MFATRPEARPATVEVFVGGTAVLVPVGASAAAAVLLAGAAAIRQTTISDAPRLPWCMMGACFDCLAEIDGVANVQACMVVVAAGMRIGRQHGARQALLPVAGTPHGMGG